LFRSLFDRFFFLLKFIEPSESRLLTFQDRGSRSLQARRVDSFTPPTKMSSKLPSFPPPCTITCSPPLPLPAVLDAVSSHCFTPLPDAAIVILTPEQYICFFNLPWRCCFDYLTSCPFDFLLLLERRAISSSSLSSNLVWRIPEFSRTFSPRVPHSGWRFTPNSPDFTLGYLLAYPLFEDSLRLFIFVREDDSLLLSPQRLVLIHI